MKLIVAIVRPFTIEKILMAFEGIEAFPGMTVTEAAGFGRGDRSAAYDALNPFKPYKRIEIAADDDVIDVIVGTIRSNAHTGRKGDGLVWVLPIEESVLI